MFSFGWSEIALTFIIVVIVIGPKEIPNMLRHIGSATKAIKKISREFKSSLNEISKENEFKEVNKSIQNIKKDIDPTNQIKEDINDLKKTTNVFQDEVSKLKNLDKEIEK